ncbi:MAG: DUF4140 domain-containing protein [Planctomycetota bacterium]
MHHARYSMAFIAVPFVTIQVLAFPSPPTQAETFTGVLTDVTLYRSSALVTRTITIPGADSDDADGVADDPRRTREILIDGLPEQLLPPSLFAEGDDSIAIRAVSVIDEPIDGSVQADVRTLDDQIKQLQTQMKRLDHEAQLIQSHLSSLQQLTSFTH